MIILLFQLKNIGILSQISITFHIIILLTVLFFLINKCTKLLNRVRRVENQKVLKHKLLTNLY